MFVIGLIEEDVLSVIRVVGVVFENAVLVDAVLLA
jgi:hypothetical protein